ncbi:MAG: SgcJ/EcaC family oxidoreductase [Chloroflexi bacterium]|nr:SgcJ/EcaC family oxidoreductase [Chloroflexota bacterium]
MDDSVIRAITKTFVAAYNRKDAVAAAQVYADDAKVLPPNMPLVSGKPAIQSFWKMAMETGMHLNLEAVDLVVDGSTAYERGVATMTTQTGTGVPRTSKGKYVTVMRRQPDGSWKLVLDIWNSDPAQTAQT